MKLIESRKEDSYEALFFDMLHVVLNLFRDYRWRKKCRKLIKRLRIQIVFQKNRREAIIRQSQADIAQLEYNGCHKNALARAKRLNKDQCVLYAYQQIEDFCDCIYINLLTNNSKMSSEVIEAVSSLVYAASRCGELSELPRMRKLIRRRFGSEFERVNVELLPGNCVNSELVYNLGKNSMLKKEKPERKKTIDAELDKTLSGKVCVVEKNDNSSNSGRKGDLKIDNKGQSHESKIKKIINKIGSKRFPSFNSTHLGTIHVDPSDNSSSIENMEIEDKESKSRLSYVHPKLPDYDDLVATFTNYKKESLVKNDSNNRSFRKWIRL